MGRRRAQISRLIIGCRSRWRRGTGEISITDVTRIAHFFLKLNLYFSIFNCSFSTLFKMHTSLNPDLDRIWLKKLSKRGTNWIIHIKFQIKKKNSNLHFKWVVRRRPICRGAWTVVFVLLQLQPTRLLQALFDVFCEMALFNANKFNPLNYRRVLPVI